MKRVAMLLVLMLVLPVQAEIFKCTVNGNTTFSDQPCAEDAEAISLKLRQPDTEAVNAQQAVTQDFQEASRINRIHTLKRKNEVLTARIDQLQQERQAELDALRKRTYLMDDGRMATREHGLFEEMDNVDAEYQERIRQLEQEIQQNQQQILQLN